MKTKTRRFNQLQPGDKVTVNTPETAYYSDYGGNPPCSLEPGEVAIIKSINVPSVTGRRGDYFHRALFTKHNQEWSVAICKDNFVYVKPEDAHLYVPIAAPTVQTCCENCFTLFDYDPNTARLYTPENRAVQTHCPGCEKVFKRDYYGNFWWYRGQIAVEREAK